MVDAVEIVISEDAGEMTSPLISPNSHPAPYETLSQQVSMSVSHIQWTPESHF